MPAAFFALLLLVQAAPHVASGIPEKYHGWWEFAGDGCKAEPTRNATHIDARGWYSRLSRGDFIRYVRTVRGKDRFIVRHRSHLVYAKAPLELEFEGDKLYFQQLSAGSFSGGNAGADFRIQHEDAGFWRYLVRCGPPGPRSR